MQNTVNIRTMLESHTTKGPMNTQVLDLNEIMVFVKVVQMGSFSKAAKALGMPNSTVSARVSSLEKRLGVSLLKRTTRQLHVTEIGQVYFEKALQGLNEITQAESSVISSQETPRGTLRITAPVFLANYLLVDVLAEFGKQYPEVDLEMILSDETLNLVSEGVDLAIRAGDLKDSSLIAKKLGTAYFAPFASPQYLKKHKTPKTPKELSEHQCIQFTPLGKETWTLEGAKGKAQVPVMTRVKVNELEVVKSLALAGLGIALLPTFFCTVESKKGKLVQLLPGWRSNPRPLHFVYPAHRYPSPNLRAFLKVASEIMSQKLKTAP